MILALSGCPAATDCWGSDRLVQLSAARAAACADTRTSRCCSAGQGARPRCRRPVPRPPPRRARRSGPPFLALGQLLDGPGLQPVLLCRQLGDLARPLRPGLLLAGPGLSLQLRLRALRRASSPAVRLPAAPAGVPPPAAGPHRRCRTARPPDVGGAACSTTPGPRLPAAPPAPRPQPELLRGRVRRHRRVRLDLGAAPAATSTRTRPSARTPPKTAPAAPSAVPYARP